MHDVFCGGIAGPGDILLARLQGGAHRMKALDILPICAQSVDDRLSHAGHDVHVNDHVSRIRDLNPDLGDG